MTGQVLFVQGAGAGTYDEWDNKLVESLTSELGPEYDIRYPRMPDEDNPSYRTWKPVLEAEFADLDDDAILIGHSFGGAILVNTVAERSGGPRFGALILLAAPFVGDGGWEIDGFATPHDLGARLPRDLAIYIYHGLDDDTAPPSHADLYARAIPQARVHRMPGRDHQLNNDLSEVARTITSR